MKTFIQAFLLALFFVASCYAQQIDVRGTASLTYKEKLTPEIRNQAIEKARLKAVENYFAQLGQAETENFDKNVDEIEKTIEKFTSDPIVLSDQDDQASKRFSIAVRVQINVARLRNTIKGSSAVASGAAGEKSKMIFVFVGREVAEVKSFDDRVVKQEVAAATRNTKDSTQKQGKESEKITSTSVATSSSKNVQNQVGVEASSRTETGGSTTRKADQVSRSVFATNDLNVSINGAFSQAGFDVSEAAFVLPGQILTNINKEFTTGNQLSPESLKSVASSLSQSAIPYFVIATLDVGQQDRDSATGMARVTVSVTGQVYDLSSWPPRTAGAVGPTQIVGLGTDPAQARTSALKRAAETASRELISRLNAKSVR